MDSPQSGPRASEIAERFVKQLNVAFKAARLYPPSSAIPKESGSTAVATLRAMLRQNPDVRLTVTKEGLFHDGAAIYPGQSAFLEFSREFFSRRLAEVRFHSGTTVTEIVEFLRILDTPLTDIQAAGGFEARLWASNIVNITVREATTRIVEHAGLADAEEAADGWPPTPESIDEILAEASVSRPRDDIVLVRLVDTPDALLEYLKHSSKGRGTTPPATWLASRIKALASAVVEIDSDAAIARLQAIADGLMALDEDFLRDALAERILPEARHDEPLAEVVRRGGIDRICEVLAAGLEDTDESREGLTRAFRNLLSISDLENSQVLGSAASALAAAGVTSDAADAVLGGVNLSQITVRDTRRGEDRSPIERIVRLVDMAPVVGGEAAEDPDRAELAKEAREGISDGDVLGALMDLITIEQRDEQFHSLMSILEDGLSLLITRGEYYLAASVTDALAETTEDPARAEHQRERLSNALSALAAKPNVRAIAAAMRRHDPESLEHRACRHLLSVLGRHAIEPLLEVLADEPDMTARKAIVALISQMAEAHVEELGARLGDDRWYFVRNIVTILGSTRTPETLSMLGRTLRYPDARVRRETIRAVSGIRDALSVEMLVASLDDSDSHNVQLAARYLGLMGHVTAVGSLERVAAGQGSGNRDAPARVEAIEALGRLRSASSLTLLRSLARTRGLRGGRTRTREVAAAAEAAIRMIEQSAPPAEEVGQ